MTRGIGNVSYVRQGSEVVVQGDYASNWKFLYTASVVKSEKWNVGDRVVTPDGRAFRYAKAGGVCAPEFGAYNPLPTIVNAVAPAQSVIQTPIQGLVVVAGTLDANVVTITKGATAGVNADGVLALDELRGGYIVVGNGANQHPQNRGIVGNPASVAGAASLDVYLDAPLTAAVTVGTTNIETMLNPYEFLKADQSATAFMTFLGLPVVSATLGQYFWVQTWGPLWVTSDNNTGKIAGGRDVLFAANGSLVSMNATYACLQRAGVGMDSNLGAASNAPMVMLQITP
jgi:hypothetical protein